ncbi:CLUMA_CG020347, isoform A [Clunio marinus]|uniref:CLUMA_CG020347, isoform A n=1 Tax=Clunio marinus TaxID=568069 RepID=A0A1J1J8U0_9DIPT|nr:CLUMA_CG020347, isoform A [Clunio marinus]
MNAIINLNHFCEIHGPQIIFSTQTIRDKSLLNNSSTISSSNVTINSICSACSSIGNKVLFVSKDNSSSIMFLSSEKAVLGKSFGTTTLRSLSCENSSNDQEGLVYYGDSRLNSLYFTFKIKDSLARGFEKCYSIVIVMKDKMFLLNTQPFLSNAIKEIVNQMQSNASKIYETEEKQFPQRAERLNTGKPSNVPPRSLKELTGELNIFAHLHSLFSWILFAGSRYHTETLALGSPSVPALYKDIEEGFAFIQIDRVEFLMNNFPSRPSDVSVNSENDIESSQGSYSLRTLKKCFSSSIFNHILYYCLVGVPIIIRGKRSRDLAHYFRDLLPSPLHRHIVESKKYNSSVKILCLPLDALIPSTNACRIDLKDEQIESSICKCPLELPPKLPSLMVKILNAVDEKAFSDTVLDRFLKALMEEWKNKVICLSHHELSKLHEMKKVLGIQPHDENLVHYWLSAF